MSISAAPTFMIKPRASIPSNRRTTAESDGQSGGDGGGEGEGETQNRQAATSGGAGSARILPTQTTTSLELGPAPCVLYQRAALAAVGARIFFDEAWQPRKSRGRRGGRRRQRKPC